ncbi:FAD-binding-domain-containing protein [Aspergillus terreus]|uniref:FAD-binding-domain-containing protein n=1 Tax=Aspergillus terreus TaxID=33178 RepID=A0A5M3ZE85_ASPTE|nr:hypothetical protein ATETN484_0013007400 [Aspergillus terreus]GFF20308.1 FAD-binding-domain-containing protein [Aspergillus terreus]
MLSLDLPGTVLTQDDKGYADQQSTYFAQQAGNLSPPCFFLPRNEQEVAQAVRLAGEKACPFAVKSGGHATFGGASNIRQGLTINLERLNEVTVSDDSSLVRIGPGNRWQQVYRELEKRNLTVPGGRTGSVGVGGLTLGGGLSFFSGKEGLVCDNVMNYQAVLANGSIINVNTDSHPDLYWALRGGGSDFALITRFDFKPLHHEFMWGGIRNYTIDQVDSLLDAYVDFGFRASENPLAYQITTIYYTDAKHHATVDLYHTEPEPDPSIFSALQEAVPYSDTTAVSRQSNISWHNYLGQPDGYRQTYWTATYKLNRNLAGFVKDVFLEEMSQLGDLDRLEARCIMQVFTADILRSMGKDGGNPLGLAGSTYPLMILNPAFRWRDPADDMRVLQAIGNLVNRVNARARAMGLYEPFVYMNYASQFQDVVESYGPENVKRLRMVARKYDPDQVFQNLQRGYFKLSGRVGW